MYSILIDYQDDEAGRVRTTAHVAGNSIPEAYSNAREELKHLNKLKLGACLKGKHVMI